MGSRRFILNFERIQETPQSALFSGEVHLTTGNSFNFILLSQILCAESSIENLNMEVSNTLDLILVMGNHNQRTL